MYKVWKPKEIYVEKCKVNTESSELTAAEIIKATLKAQRLKEAERKRQEELKIYQVQAELNSKWLSDFQKRMNLEMSQEDFADLLLRYNMVIPIFPCDHWIDTYYGSERLNIPGNIQDYFKQLGKRFGVTVDLKVNYREEWHGGGDDMISTDHFKSAYLIFNV